MHVIIFIIIAYALRHRFLDEDDGKWGEILYYGLSAAWTPLIGIPLFVMIKKSKWTSGDNYDGGCNPYTP